ncbi:acyl-CoA thioester hydrolase [Poseidonocella pacifica]|uniref:Acyl-CoA thioester hydrolase n=1 Tax=Poseidonocella pacifica TaxID=871651 RepID=A0A1I0WAW6_9RHOB|nr:thioesterase family protein [Poseidonocella pacifica]SFA85859.1 acyl-CoA thioester hydrolase [Poseidonocella pacifica]
MTLPYLIPLCADQQRDFGIAAPRPFAMADRVRFAEIDALRHVNNVAYLRWFEHARVEYFRAWGLHSHGEGQPRTVLRHITVDYRAELLLHDDYVVASHCSEFRTTSFTLRSEVWKGDQRCTVADAVVVLLKPDLSGRMAIPERVLERFINIDGASKA